MYHLTRNLARVHVVLSTLHGVRSSILSQGSWSWTGTCCPPFMLTFSCNSSTLICRYYSTGPHYPNASTNTDSQAAAYTKHCGNGCLYNLRADPTERDDLAAAMPDKLGLLRQKLSVYETTVSKILPPISPRCAAPTVELSEDARAMLITGGDANTASVRSNK